MLTMTNSHLYSLRFVLKSQQMAALHSAEYINSVFYWSLDILKVGLKAKKENPH